jgi:hypothetical protein
MKRSARDDSTPRPSPYPARNGSDGTDHRRSLAACDAFLAASLPSWEQLAGLINSTPEPDPDALAGPLSAPPRDFAPGGEDSTICSTDPRAY